MNYLRLAMLLLFAVTAQGLYADSIPTFQITSVDMVMVPNYGGGGQRGLHFDRTRGKNLRIRRYGVYRLVLG
jgi:hypothetical protein